MALLDRLYNDRSLAVFAGKFVPLKLVTEGQNEEWAVWSRRYRAVGNGIPQLFVIRADGEKLYAKSGALPGDQLPQMLMATLQQSGRVFSDAEVAVLDSSVTKAEQALADQQYLAAARALAPVSEVGTPGQMESFSDLALRANQIADKLIEQARAKMAQAKTQFETSETAFEGVLALVEIEDAFAEFPQLKSEITSTIREIKQDKQLRREFKPAEALIRARGYARSENEKTRKRAEPAYKLILSRYADSAASTIARTELAAINPDALAETTVESQSSDAADQKTAEPIIREWTDRSGKYTIIAKFLEFKSGKVRLEKEDGSILSIPIGRLSQADRQYVEQRK